jgi:enoyl-CoA hydratase/carnithine racemase
MLDTSSTILLQEYLGEGILCLTLNDAGRRNPLSEAMLESLADAITAASSDPSTRVIILAANGPAFSSGHDLKELTAARAEAGGGKPYFAKIMAMCSGVMQAIVACPKPVIAEVDGIAAAAGCQLVASCDLAIASDAAKFCTPGVHIGLFCSTPMVALSRNVSSKHAMEMLLMGDMVPAARAAEIGLINKVVSADCLREATMTFAEKIAAKSSRTLTIGKRAFYEQREMDLAQAYAYASDVMVENMMIHDAQEGICAFIEKRAPDWQNR